MESAFITLNHPLVAAGREERLAPTGRSIQDVWHVVFRFKSAATG